MKQTQKMCKSPKVPNATAAYKSEKIVISDYETNCTTIGSNNLHLVKKPQVINAMSPVYSNPSPGYPQSPYSSPAGLKSPSPQSMKPPTPQPNSFPVMQIISNNHLLARPIQAAQQQNVIKLKPHLNILPKPSASPQASPKPSVSPQIVIPTNQQATIMPTAQPLLLNQMPQVLTTPSGVHFIVRPQAKLPNQVQAQTQGLILQQGQPMLQLQPPRSQNLVRVLTNGMQLAPPTTTYVTHLATPQQQTQQHNIHHHQGTILATTTSPSAPKKKPKKKKQKLDLANIMKLSGIGDEDDIQFESDTSQSESDHNSVHSQPNTPQPRHEPQNLVHQSPQHHGGHQNLLQHAGGLLQTDGKPKMGNIQISAMQQPTISTQPLVQFQQVLNQGFPGNVIPTSQATTAQGVPFSSFLAPNITINNGLMMQQRSGVAYKLSFSEDGRLILHHDPSVMQQDMQQQQQQVLVQGLFGLNSLVLQPSMDAQQVHSQTVQTIQQQSVQTIQQQTVQSQTIQTVQQQSIQPQIQAVQPQTLQQTVQQTIQHQTVSQPMHGQPMQIVQPQPMQNLNQSIQSQTVHSIQSQVQPNIPIALQNHIQGQLQSLIQSQLHQNMSSASNISIQSQPISVNSHIHNLNQPIVVHSQPIQSILTNTSNHNLQTSQQQQNTINSAINSSINSSINLQNLHQQQQQQQQQSQGIQTIMQGLSQPTQTQPILKVQPFQKTQPPVQTVHPQPAAHNHQNNEPVNGSPLTPDQVEVLRRNGSITVNGQTYLMQRQVCKTPDACVGDVKPHVKMSPKGKATVKKVAAKVVSAKAIVAETKEKMVNCVAKEVNKGALGPPAPSPGKHVVVQNHVQIQPQTQPQPPQNQQQPQQIVLVQKPTTQPSALVQPSVQTTQPQVPQPKIHVVPQPKPHQVAPSVQPQPVPTTAPNVAANQPEANPQEVDRLLGQIIEETHSPTQNAAPHPPKTITIAVQNSNKTQQEPTPVPQNITTVQLSQEQQQYLQRVKLQIQNLAARYQPGDKDVQAALMMLFEEQNKILVSGRLLSPDKVHYHNNYLTIMNPEQVLKSDNDPIVVTSAAAAAGPPQQNHVAPLTVVKRETPAETISSQQVVTVPNVISKPIVSASTTNSSSSSSEGAVTVVPPALTNVIAPSSSVVTTTATKTTTNQSPMQAHVSMPTPSISVPQAGVRVSSVVHHHPQVNVVQAAAPPPLPLAPAPAPPPQPTRYLPMYTKAQLIEQQMNTDQNGAVKPDIHTPFKDKMDTCKRLIRYHCFDQPVLSTKDLGKADEIFELTAKHFIDKFSKMSDKYKYLRLKESVREVPTSELMMLDRMFLAEEQQSLIKLRQEAQEQASLPPPLIEITPPAREETPEEYDEWACIQKELSSIQPQNAESKPSGNHPGASEHPGKRTLSNDARFETSRLETLKKFRVDKQKKAGETEHVKRGISSAQQQFFVNSAANSRQLNHQRMLHHHAMQHVSHTIHHHASTSGFQGSSGSYSVSSVSSVSSQGSSNGASGPPPADNIIDEQVQSAIDSILNLQQSALDLDDVNSILS